MLKLGYVYDYSFSTWYLLNGNGLYDPIDEEIVKGDIIRFLDKRSKMSGSFNFGLKSVQAILERVRSISFWDSCFNKFEDFKINHPEYDIIPDSVNDLIPGRFIAVKNGVINTQTMELLPHCAYLLHHNVLNFNYEPLTKEQIIDHPAYDTYLGIINDKPTLELYLWWVGLVLFSNDLGRVLMFLYGTGGTGKTTLSTAIGKLLNNEFRSIQATQVKETRFLTAEFENKRLVTIDEISDRSVIDTAYIKQLTGGMTEFTLEKKYKNFYTAKLYSKFLFIGNNYPSWSLDPAMCDRLFIIPCNNRQEQSVRDLLTCDEYLNWLFNAAYYYYVVKAPQKKVKYLSELRTDLMLDELDKYRDTDGFNYWLKDYCGVDKLTVEIVQTMLDRMEASKIYAVYSNFTRDTGGSPMSAKIFNVKLRQEYRLVVRTTRRSDCDKSFKGYRIEE